MNLPPLTEILDERVTRDLVIALDLAGTFVFAISGAMQGIRRRLDVYGVLVVSVAAATAGGITRDLLIGSVPPAAVSDWRYCASAIAAGLITFFCYSPVTRRRTALLVFDAAGLAFFAVAGTQKALDFGLSPPMAAVLGMLTGVGGGIARDLLGTRTPSVLRGDLYAVAALAGAALVVAGDLLGWPTVAAAIGAALFCFAFRVLAILRGWGLPVARPDDGEQGRDRE